MSACRHERVFAKCLKFGRHPKRLDVGVEKRILADYPHAVRQIDALESRAHAKRTRSHLLEPTGKRHALDFRGEKRERMRIDEPSVLMGLEIDHVWIDELNEMHSIVFAPVKTAEFVEEQRFIRSVNGNGRIRA